MSDLHMTIDRSAASLMGLDAVVIDTETTGLDASKARVVEVAAMNLTAGRLDRHSPFRRLVNPGVTIPSDAVRIHGIDDAAVASAASFGSVWPELSTYMGDKILIGHSLDFDIAVLRGECRRIGKALKHYHALDVRKLGELAAPDLRDFSLEGLTAFLGIRITGRHSALGDVIATGEIFLALVPLLRHRGIRTLGEANRASLERADIASTHRILDRSSAAIAPPAEAVRIDIQPYRERAGSIMTTPARIVEPGMTVADALNLMAQERISSVFVAPGGRPAMPEDTGIVTERDVLRAVADRGAAALVMPVSSAMARPLITVPSDAFGYVAIARMNRFRIRHLGVTDATGRIAGALSARDLLRLRAEAAIELGDEIDQSGTVHELASGWSKLPYVASELSREGLSAREIAAVISLRCRELTGRATALAEHSMRQDGKGSPPAEYAFLVLGSAGRDESLLAMDQDNALVYAEGAPQDADTWFGELAERVADNLHESGVPYCKGGVMAKNPQWRGSVNTWHKRIEDWILRSTPEDLLSVDIFFDLRAAYGAGRLAESLRQYALDQARGQAAFAKLLIESSGPVMPALNWYGGFRTAQGRIDLKRTGLFAIVRNVRAISVARHLSARPTISRIEALKASHAGSETDLDALSEAHDLFLELILRQQLDDIRVGRPPSSSVEVRKLSRRERERLKGALKIAAHADEMAHALLFGP